MYIFVQTEININFEETRIFLSCKKRKSEINHIDGFDCYYNVKIIVGLFMKLL